MSEHAPPYQLAKLHQPRRFAAPSTLRPIRVGQVVSMPEVVPFDLTEEMLNMHMCVLGVSGGGKSKFLELFARRVLIGGERGMCVIDPHGDLAEDILSYAAQRYAEKDPTLLDRIHYVYPGKGIVPRYDPFRRPQDLGLPRWHRDDAEDAWLKAKVDRVAEILQMNQGQDGFEGMPRLQRVLRNCLLGCGILADGRHLPVADTLVLLDIYHPRHGDVYRAVEPHLDPDTRSDFAVLHGFEKVRDFRQETESTFNRLRTFLSGVVPAMFTSDGSEPTIDWHHIVRSKGILLVNLRETDYFSREQKSAVGKLFIHEVLTAIANTPRPQRQPFNLVIDEAGEFLCEDVKRALGAVRKYKLSITLAGQDLSTFRTERVDLANKILSQCGTVVCFQQQCEEDLEILQTRLGRGNYDFTKLYTESQLNDGYDVEEWEDSGESFMVGKNWGENRSEGSSRSHTETETESESEQSNWSAGHTSSRSEQRGTSRSAGQGLSLNPLGEITRSESMGHSLSESTGTTLGDSETRGGGSGSSRGFSVADGQTRSIQSGTSTGGSEGKTTSVTRKKVMIPRFVIVERETGSLLNSVADQAERQKTVLYSLDTGEAVVKCRRVPFAFIIQTDVVRDVFPSEELKFRVLEWFEGELFKHHPYNHTPRLKGAQEARLARFLGVGSRPVPDAAPPAGRTSAEESGFGA
jgi:hypothetical protein